MKGENKASSTERQYTAPRAQPSKDADYAKTPAAPAKDEDVLITRNGTN